MVMTWAALLLAATASLTQGLSIETDSPDALCPELSATRAAVRSRIGVVGVQGRAGWKARYTLWHAPGQNDQDFVRLQVIDPDGTEQLNRDLPLKGSSCSTMASAIALVLERYFSEVGRTDRVADPAPVAPPAARPPPSTLVLSIAGGALAAPSSPAMSAGLALERQRMRVLLQAALPLIIPDESTSGSESVALRSTVPVRLAVQLRVPHARWGLHVGPEVMCAYDHAHARLAVSGNNSRVAWGAGVQGGGYLALGGGGWRLTVDAAVDRVFGGGRFTIDGAETLPLPWRGLAMIGIAGAFGGEGSRALPLE